MATIIDATIGTRDSRIGPPRAYTNITGIHQYKDALTW
jgi:hypothetical protein